MDEKEQGAQDKRKLTPGELLQLRLRGYIKVRSKINEEELVAKPCFECGGERVLAQLNLDTTLYGYDWKLKQPAGHSGVIAVVCSNCGLTFFYAEEPHELVVKRPDKPISEDQSV